ncbi:MAG: type II toxin-antitoxin system HicA family toxin [Thaumarchaeota archaeon]|nr:type II toxin-antitoxin system HicA family toxin [Nitrososphaerota archaeon]MDE1878583.1 type II toxin-antitoxin system HicA family toxin [Nitrososphaerota archaeon]
MSKLPRVSGNAMIKYLVNKKGFQISHQKGSHVSLRNYNSNRFTSVPAKNDELGTGLTKQIIDDCGITRDEFTLDYHNGLIK